MDFSALKQKSPPRLVRACLRSRPKIQFAEAEAMLVARAVRQFRECRFLVFGVGNDSAMWHGINSSGATVFLEHNPEWIEKIRQRDGPLDIRRVEYTTRITQWREWLDAPRRARLELPCDIREGAWDVVLVDAPNGFAMVEEYPGFGTIHGRMQSIEAASLLVAPGGFVFVHDAQREVEAACCDRLLKRDGRLLFRFLMEKNNGNLTEMRCYFFPGPTSGLTWQARWLQLLAWWLGVWRIPDSQERVRAASL